MAAGAMVHAATKKARWRFISRESFMFEGGGPHRRRCRMREGIGWGFPDTMVKARARSGPMFSGSSSTGSRVAPPGGRTPVLRRNPCQGDQIASKPFERLKVALVQKA